jgi:microcystin-dependent protein
MRIASSGAVSVTGAVSIGGSLAVTGDITSNGASVLPPGVIWEYGGLTAPTGWLLCDGSAVSRSVYLALYNILGITYGAGDGTTTFNLPDRRGKFGVGADGTYTRGTSSGSTTTSSAGSHNHTGLTSSTTLTTAQIPAHSHTITDPGHVHSAFIGLTIDGTFTNAGGTGPYPNGYANTLSAVTGITINNAGGGTGHDHAISTDGTHTHTVTPPYVASNYIIKT